MAYENLVVGSSLVTYWWPGFNPLVRGTEIPQAEQHGHKNPQKPSCRISSSLPESENYTM